ncbi:MAG: nucleoside deaminase [Candidatus Omnitrophica bacterium]|nr:nucleoside deaminase [Candidatus Omnitrophota bacterium]
MELAIKQARKGASEGHGGPFGAVIVKDDKIISSAHNSVLRDNDPTRHAEIRAISMASEELGSYDLSGCSIYVTTEPCPMCFSAIHWARIDRVVYGTRIEDVKKLGFNEMTISACWMKEEGASKVEIEPSFMRDECVALLKFWEGLPNRQVY